MRLKSLAPRKGKIEVEVYDKRIMEIEKHMMKYEIHTKLVLERNKNDDEGNMKSLEQIDKDYQDFNILFEKINKGIEEEQSLKGLEDKYKKFRTSFYEINLKIQENENKIKIFSKSSPENIIYNNKNFIKSLVLFEKGGTYSQSEIEYYDKMVQEINNLILESMTTRDNNNKTKDTTIKSSVNSLMEKIDSKYNAQKEYIQAKDGIGKKYGAPKRLANDITISIKMKCNQAQEGLDKLYNMLVDMINLHWSQKNNTDYIKSNITPLEIRKQIIAINNCSYYYGKYIDAFKQLFVYNDKRISLKENAESIDITGKEELEEDSNRKLVELSYMGLLSKNINVSFSQELNSIDDSVKIECSKIYIGQSASFINNPDKIPLSFFPFIQKLKQEMELFRIKSIRDLRTYCQKFFKTTIELGSIINDFIYHHNILICKENQDNIMKEFSHSLSNSENIKKVLNSKIGPHLANPYYINDLKAIIEEENSRQEKYLKEIDNTQYNLILNIERFSNDYFIRVNNNFEAFINLFDCMLLEEDIVSLGDEEYLRERKDFNFLLKLKQQNKPGIDLNSKRAFKKIYPGIDRNKLKINFLEKYKQIIIKIINSIMDFYVR